MSAETQVPEIGDSVICISQCFRHRKIYGERLKVTSVSRREITAVTAVSERKNAISLGLWGVLGSHQFYIVD